MVALTRARPLDFGGSLPDAAQQAIKDLLEENPRASRRIYAALARKVWQLLIEHRFDSEIRDWHALLNNVKAKVRGNDQEAAERVTALADLLRQSISFAEISPALEIVKRPKARAILDRLARDDRFVRRRTLLDELNIGGSHLSNVVTQLVAHNLIERQDSGKEAEFRITQLGRDLISDKRPAAKPAEESLFNQQIASLLTSPPEPVSVFQTKNVVGDMDWADTEYHVIKFNTGSRKGRTAGDAVVREWGLDVEPWIIGSHYRSARRFPSLIKTR